MSRQVNTLFLKNVIAFYVDISGRGKFVSLSKGFGVSEAKEFVEKNFLACFHRIAVSVMILQNSKRNTRL